MTGTNGSLIEIVHVSFGLDVGGQEKLLVEFARHLDRSRFHLRFVSIGLPGLLAEQIEQCGWPVTALGATSGLHPGLILRLTRLFRRWRPDVIHTHDQRALFYSLPAARLAHVPTLIHTRHGRDCHSTPRQLVVFRRLSRWVDRFVCVSSDVERLSVEQGMALGRIQTILNGVDIEEFRFSGSHPGGSVVAVARLSPEKDVANLIRAFALASLEDTDIHLEIAGDGPCREELRQLVAELGLERIVSFLGELRAVPEFLARGSLFVLPSRSEGVSLTLLEAMACGLPVVATRVGGTPEVVVDDETGILVPPSDPAALAAAILRVWRDPQRARLMGEAGRLLVERQFGVSRMLDDYMVLYGPSNRSHK